MPEDNNNPNQKQHYYMLSGELVFYDPENDRSATTRSNALLHSEKQLVTLRMLQRGQQSLQMNVLQKVGPNVQFLDATIISFNYLGYMTAEEFEDGAIDPAVQDNMNNKASNDG